MLTATQACAPSRSHSEELPLTSPFRKGGGLTLCRIADCLSTVYTPLETHMRETLPGLIWVGIGCRWLLIARKMPAAARASVSTRTIAAIRIPACDIGRANHC